MAGDADKEGRCCPEGLPSAMIRPGATGLSRAGIFYHIKDNPALPKLLTSLNGQYVSVPFAHKILRGTASNP